MGSSRTGTCWKATALGTLVVLTVPLTGCDTAESSGTAGSPEVPTAVSTSAAAATPGVDPAVYRRTLAGAVAPLDKALRTVDRAREGRSLDRALDGAAEAATAAAGELETVRTPDDALTGHGGFVRALRELSEKLTDAKSDGGRCSGASRVALGSGGGLRTVRDSATALTDLGYPVRLRLPRTEKAQHRRLANGALVKDSGRSGLGQLTVSNGTDSDAVVSLTRGERVVFTVYVRRGADTTVRRVENGTYTVYFSTGEDWNASKRSFTTGCVFEKFDSKAKFRTIQVSGGTQYDVLTFSLAKTIGGNATTSEVPADAFPE